MLRINFSAAVPETTSGIKAATTAGVNAHHLPLEWKAREKGKGMFMGLKYFLEIMDLVVRDKCPYYYFSLFK